MIIIMPSKFVEYFITKANKRRTLAQDTYLFHQGDPVRSVFIVEEGLVELTRHQLNGSSIVLQRASTHMVLAEASLYSAQYHCDGIVTLPSTVFEWTKAAFLERIQEDKGFSNLWVKHLAQEIQSARYRSEILSLKTVSERLDGWLVWQGSPVPPKGQWKNIAAQIGVSPEALYREMAKRRSK